MIKILDKNQCCGCTACAAICAHDAITMTPDSLGFLYPVIDETKCVECGLCEKVCSFNPKYNIEDNLALPLAYAARHKDMREVETSRSGAAFIALSDYILALGGVVYGAGYTDHFRVIHKRATTKEQRNEFKGSKYVQSDLRGVFKEVKNDLRNGLLVLFSGTPCQISGLKSFVGNKLKKNLYLVDIICHGVPSPYIWRDYIKYLENKEKKTITAVDFRDKKRFGWKAHKESFLFNDTYTYTYTYTFYKHISFRPSCGVCHFTNLKRTGDITIADYWGWEKTDPTFNADDKGCSLILINTAKGQTWFENIKKDLFFIPAKLENCMQTHLRRPSDIHPLSKAFAQDYPIYGFEKTFKKYGLMGWKYECKVQSNRIKNKIKRIIKIFK